MKNCSFLNNFLKNSKIYFFGNKPLIFFDYLIAKEWNLSKRYHLQLLKHIFAFKFHLSVIPSLVGHLVYARIYVIVHILNQSFYIVTGFILVRMYNDCWYFAIIYTDQSLYIMTASPVSSSETDQSLYIITEVFSPYI